MKELITEFEQLDAWKEARSLTKSVYSLTRHDELNRDWGLCAQIRRAAVSMMTNVAEGFGRRHLREKLQFYNVARASGTEVRSLLYVIEDNFPLVAPEATRLRSAAAQSGRLVSGLIRSTEARRVARILQTVLLMAAIWLLK
jgi:four helix bundle protein